MNPVGKGVSYATSLAFLDKHHIKKKKSVKVRGAMTPTTAEKAQGF